MLRTEYEDCVVTKQPKLLTIRQASGLTGLNVHTLRYYERIGLITAVERAASGHRRYHQVDVERLIFLNYLRKTGMSLEQMREYAALLEKGEAGVNERILILEAHRTIVANWVEELQQMLSVIDYKLNSLKTRAE